MKSHNFLNEIQRKYVDAFKTQNPELFDVVFDIGGKKLYANKLRLSLASTTFESMLSNQFWKNKNDAIPIKDYKFDDFKELLTFIYSGECEINDLNFMVMLDMAEYYQMEHLKEQCKEFLLKIELNFDNVFGLIELTNKYSMIQLKEKIQVFISVNFSIFVKCDGFKNASKAVINEFVTYTLIPQEATFQAVYEWAEYQATKKQHELNDEIFNMNDAIKAEIIEFLPHFEFDEMNVRFLVNYVVQKDFIFSHDEFYKIFDIVQSYAKIKITNLHGYSIFGYLSSGNAAVEIIQSLKNRESDNGGNTMIFWETDGSGADIRSTPCPVKKRDGVKWYLVITESGNIGVIQYPIYGDYLLAEMYSEKFFIFTRKCKIEIE